MDSLGSVKSSTLSWGARKMIDVRKRRPNGWSMIQTPSGYQIRDDDDQFVCEAETPQRLEEILNLEFELAQTFASMMYVLNTTEPAEA